MGYVLNSHCVVIVAFLIGIFTAQDSTISNNKIILQDSGNSSLYRLPKNVIPKFYDILLLTNVTRGQFNYEGQVVIDLYVTEKTKQVILHAEKLKIIDEKTVIQKVLSRDNYEEISIEDQYNNEDTQFHVITFFDYLTTGDYLLKLYFHAEVLDDKFGFYRTSYKINNETRWMGITQFSPTFARRAFPCMDEPGFKAAFQLRIGHYENETVTSNTFSESRIATSISISSSSSSSSSSDGGVNKYYITTFKKTPRMSTYLLGWAIHDFHRVNSSEAAIALWTHFKDSELPIPLTILVEGPRIYAALEEWTGLRNPLGGKLEQFAVPDFNFNGMENWGLITYRESVPLVSEELAPVRAVHDSLVTIAHEYAHSWFGNLVTPSFWDAAWLKEGFATYFSYLSMHLLREDWRMMHLFSLEVLQTSLLADSKEHNRTMNGRNVGSPKSAKATLDFVTYDKGASIIRMIAEILGNDTFQNAMRQYLRENQYQAVTVIDLYKHLEQSINSSAQTSTFPTTIGEVIESWASQPNYPLVSVSRVDSRHLRVSQEVFYLNRSLSLKNSKRHWWVPIKVIVQTNKNDLHLTEIIISNWLEPTNKSKLLELPENMSENSWFLLNPEQIGYYRVDYDDSNWESLKRLLDSHDYQSLPSSSRAALIDDAFNLARAGYKKYKLAFDLARYLSREVAYEPWVAACRAIRLLDGKLRGAAPHVQSIFRRYAIDLIAPIYKEFQYKTNSSDSRVKKMHQNLILSTACSLNLADCVSTARSFFKDWISNANKSVPANFKDFVYRTGIFYGTNEDWIELWQRFLSSRLDSEKVIMLKALSYTRNATFINRYLEFSIQPTSDIKKQYRFTIIQSIITGSSINVNHVIHYMDTNLEKIMNLRGREFLKQMLMAIGDEIISSEQEEQFSQFIGKNSQRLGKSLDAAKLALKSAKENIKWINSLITQVINYLT